jgi:hypothetical protein
MRDGRVLTESRNFTLGGSMIFTKRLRSQDHTRSFVVDKSDEHGWEIREEQDNEVVRRTWLHDWHRVENAMMRFGLEATQLQSAGWIEVQAPASSVV